MGLGKRMFLLSGCLRALSSIIINCVPVMYWLLGPDVHSKEYLALEQLKDNKRKMSNESFLLCAINGLH